MVKSTPVSVSWTSLYFKCGIHSVQTLKYALCVLSGLWRFVIVVLLLLDVV